MSVAWPGNMSEPEKDRIAWENREKVMALLRKRYPKEFAAAEAAVKAEAEKLADKVVADLKKKLKQGLAKPDPNPMEM